MLDPTQIVLITAATIMTTLLVVIGIQLIFILKDVKKILTRVENMTGQIESIGLGLSSGYSEFISFFTGASKLFEFIHTLSTKRKTRKNE